MCTLHNIGNIWCNSKDKMTSSRNHSRDIFLDDEILYVDQPQYVLVNWWESLIDGGYISKHIASSIFLCSSFVKLFRATRSCNFSCERVSVLFTTSLYLFQNIHHFSHVTFTCNSFMQLFVQLSMQLFMQLFVQLFTISLQLFQIIQHCSLFQT